MGQSAKQGGGARKKNQKMSETPFLGLGVCSKKSKNERNTLLRAGCLL